MGCLTPPKDWALSAKDIVAQTPRAQVVQSANFPENIYEKAITTFQNTTQF